MEKNQAPTVLVTARYALLPSHREQAGRLLPIPTTGNTGIHHSTALISVTGTNRENALACKVLYMSIAQHCEYKKEKKKSL